MLSNHQINPNYNELDQKIKNKSNSEQALIQQDRDGEPENKLEVDIAIIKFVLAALIFDVIFFASF